jgi:hypothetical protein
MSLCLSKREIRELTGSPLRKKQRAFLVKNGIRHYLDEHDRPVVLRSTVEGAPAEAAPKAWSPNKAA